MRRSCLLLLLTLGMAPGAEPQGRPMRPEDLFRTEGVGAIAWSPDRSRAVVEVYTLTRWLDLGIPVAPLHLLDARGGSLRTLIAPSRGILGFFGAAWSPNGRRLLFLSADTNGVVRPWLWDGGAPRMLAGLELRDALADPPMALWSDDGHAVFRVRDSGAPREGMLYVKINRDRNVADAWAKARKGVEPAVTVHDSRGPGTVASSSRIVSVELATGKVTNLARGEVHHARLSADRRTLTYRWENPSALTAPASSFFGPEAVGEAAYDKVNWGGEVVYADVRTGVPVDPPPPNPAADSAPKSPALRVEQGSGTRLVLSRTGRPDTTVWRGNRWVGDVRPGRAEKIAYRSLAGAPLTAWLLYPPGHTAGQRIPVIAYVYPSAVYGDQVPHRFGIPNNDFEHPQLLAALGYGVLYPSMPEPAKPVQQRGLDSLTAGVLPILDTLIARGIADPARIGVMGQSAGGYATIGLITRTDRFRTAIESAGYADLVAEYTTFYGEWRWGDAGNPVRSQLLRMLQYERGYHGAAGPPWEAPEQYRENSSLLDLAKTRTPLMIIQGESDFIPLQQGEAVFTTLLRQDKRVRFVRYTGEGHTITARANVLNMWKQIEEWLRETLPPG